MPETIYTLSLDEDINKMQCEDFYFHTLQNDSLKVKA